MSNRKRVYEAILKELEEKEMAKESKKNKGKVLRFCQHCRDNTGAVFMDYRLKCYFCNSPMREATPKEIKEHKRYQKMWAKEDAEHKKEERKWLQKAKKR